MRLDKCRSCGSANIREVIDLGNFYLSTFSGKRGRKYPLHLVRCTNCTLIQLRETTPPKVLYTDDYGYYSGVNQTMRDHLAEIAHIAERIVGLKKGDMVIDIGCNDGTLLNSYKTKGLYKVGYDPVAKFEKYAKGYVFYPQYFNRNLAYAKVITAISMFYDLDDPNQFLTDVVCALGFSGIFIIQQNYLKSMLENTAFDNIVHEHLEYYSLYSLNHLLEKHGLEVFDIEENSLNGGSFRTYIKFKQNPSFKISPNVNRFLKKEDEFFAQSTIFTEFKERVELMKRVLYSALKEIHDNGLKIFVYGASTRGNTLLQYCGLDHSMIQYAVERNLDKVGKKIVSVDIPIISEEEARVKHPDYMLVLPWFFQEEIVKREKDYLESGGHFLFPLPKLTII